MTWATLQSFHVYRGNRRSASWSWKQVIGYCFFNINVFLSGLIKYIFVCKGFHLALPGVLIHFLYTIGSFSRAQQLYPSEHVQPSRTM